VDAGDLIISIVGTIGAVAIIGQSLNKANLTENCAKIVHIEGYNTEFLYYYLSSAYGQNEISKRTIGEVQAKLPLMNISDIPVPVVSLPEQEAIAEKLTAADERIQTERNYLEKLHNIKQGLMQDLLDPNKVCVDALM
jgi:type I restriction enzyme S subunit